MLLKIRRNLYQTTSLSCSEVQSQRIKVNGLHSWCFYVFSKRAAIFGSHNIPFLTYGMKCILSYMVFSTRSEISTKFQSLHKKWSFPLRNSSVNVTKSAVSRGFGHIYWRNPYWKTLFFVRRILCVM